ncbi:MAG: phospholipase domain-containing protein, partial [Actinoallomurus sp.]
ADPDLWSKTALFICYDENDGFFDHVVPPYAPPEPGRSTVDLTGELYAPPAGDANTAGPYGLGQRVPMFVVSPWSTGGWVDSEVFDHTSIVRFMERRFGVHEPNISPWRRAVCGDLTTAFDFGRVAARMPSLPDTSGYTPPDHDRHEDYVPKPPAKPALPRQERGLRPARPLPYDLAADFRVTAGGPRIDFANHGAAGASFFVTSATRTDGPWTHTVGAGRRLSGDWTPASGAYDFTVHGPNGFLRRFTGAGTAGGPEVTARHDGKGELVRLVLTNAGTTAVRLTVKDAYGDGRPAGYRLRPGASATHTVRLRRGHGWYDLSVTSGQDEAFLRRFAGHVETGRPSTSDPAIAAR